MTKFRHDKWYSRIFSNPKILEELFTSFVDEAFVKSLDFSQVKKLNTKFVPASERARHADLIFEIACKNKRRAYIYLFLEFQSTVDKLMPLRMARYILEFYDELIRSGKE
ncbi:MAG: Rpn family recombination-promoting nuclease/putative transposase, partial [Chitinispirillaceae bacterium]|nr:Rpn family recombination-promoting nuclease/putative transposase [Chitinispirillaceae bacterium]